MEAGALRGELDRAPRRRRTPSSAAARTAGRRPRAAPSRTRGRCAAGRRGSRRASASRCCTGDWRRASSRPVRARRGRGASASPRCSVDVRARVAEVRLERRVELDGVHARDALCEVAREDAESGADLEHDVARVERGEPFDHAEDVLVDEEVLAELLLRRDVHAGARSTRPRCGRSAVRARAGRRRAPARARRACASTYAGSLRCPRTGCGARYGASVSARIRSAGTCVAASRRSTAFGNDRVAGERDVPAALERSREHRAATRSSGGRRGPSKPSSAASVSASAARVWITTGFAVSTAIASMRAKSSRCASARRVVAEPVEPGLADGDRLRVVEQRAHLGDVGVRRVTGLVRVDAEDREDAVVRVGELDRAATAGGSRPDGEDPADTGLGRARDDVGGIVVERVEVRVRVDHRPSRASSSAAVSGGSLRKSGRGSLQLPARRKLARRPRARAALVVAGQHFVRRAVVLGDGRELERAAEVAVVAEQLVDGLRRERKERREERLQRVDGSGARRRGRSRRGRGRSSRAPTAPARRRTGSRAS